MMQLSRSSGQKGFTLIEMSIVLVIIGLIIGGILKGQEVIESARQKNVITQIDSYRAAINTFFDRFNGVPGDYGCADTGAGNLCGGVGRLSAADDGNLLNGGGNGTVGATNTATNATMVAFDGGAANSENVQFWGHLVRANLIDGVVATVAAVTGYGEGNGLPAFALPNSGGTIVYGNYNDFAADARTTHWLRIHGFGASAGVPSAVFSGRQMFELDKKLDDSLPASGGFRSGLQNAACGTNANGAYTATNDQKLCTAYIDLIQ